jgi:hypothetical protein
MKERIEKLITDARVAAVVVIAVVNHFAVGTYAYYAGVKDASGEVRVVNEYRESFRAHYAKLRDDQRNGTLPAQISIARSK